ncbi:glycosyltransferase family 2 protein, partial [Candidatus Omnitrophota bacterium]
KVTLTEMGRNHIVVLGNGDLTELELQRIGEMEYIDALGLNIFRGKVGLEALMNEVRGTQLKMPIIITEFGFNPSFTDEYTTQKAYFKEVIPMIQSNMVGRNNVLAFAYICEATDQLWKEQEFGPEEAQLGILEKDILGDIGLLVRKFDRDMRYVDWNTIDPEVLLARAWESLEYNDHAAALANADKVMELFGDVANRQQALLVREQGAQPKKSWNEQDWERFGILNLVGTSYFIKIAVLHEMGDRVGARIVYDELTNRYSNAIFRLENGTAIVTTDAVVKLYPELFERNIFKTWEDIALGAGIATILLIIPSLFDWFKRVKKSFVQRRKKTDASERKISNEVVFSWVKKFFFFAMIFGSYYLLFELCGWWFHPIRAEYYFVSKPLFFMLSYVGGFMFFFNYLVFYIISRAKKPRHMKAKRGLKVAMVTTYIASEPLEMVEKTLLKMKAVTYKHDTFVLDESGSKELKKFCVANGLKYFSRKGMLRYQQSKPPFKAKTKGGNLNAWLDKYGDQYKFVTFLDGDHQPKPEYLSRVLGYFQDPRVAFVQAPQIFRNRKENLIAAGSIGGNSYFVGPIQMGLYGMDANVINGSHSSFRIEALKSIGLYGVHNADDILTSIRLYAKEWKGVYVPEILATGLAPANWKDNLRQQYRWSNSIFDLIFTQGLFVLYNLKRNQKFAFFFMGAFYMLQVNFCVLLVMPIISVIINQPPVNADLLEFAMKFFPVYISQLVVMLLWGGKFFVEKREKIGIWIRSGLIEIAGSLYVLKALFKAIVRKELVRTNFVADKGKDGHESSLRMFTAHIMLAILAIVAFVYLSYSGEVLWQTQGIKLFLALEIAIIALLLASNVSKKKGFVSKEKETLQTSVTVDESVTLQNDAPEETKVSTVLKVPVFSEGKDVSIGYSILMAA